jgi:hypothetical protein
VSTYLYVRLGLAIIGIIVWGYAVFVDDARLRLVGIVVLAASLILRLIPKRFRGGENRTT